MGVIVLVLEWVLVVSLAGTHMLDITQLYIYKFVWNVDYSGVQYQFLHEFILFILTSQFEYITCYSMGTDKIENILFKYIACV